MRKLMGQNGRQIGAIHNVAHRRRQEQTGATKTAQQRRLNYRGLEHLDADAAVDGPRHTQALVANPLRWLHGAAGQTPNPAVSNA